MENKVLYNHKDQPVRVLARGIASVVTYTSNRNSVSGGFSTKQRCVWPNSLFDDSKYISRKVVSRY